MCEKHNLSLKDGKMVVDLILGTLIDSIADGSGVEVRGFGSFQRKERASYVGIHPRSRKQIVIAKKYIPFFKAGKSLKKIVKNINNS